MNKQRRTKSDFRFRDARLCFSFTATLGDRGKPQTFERLKNPDDLGRWCVESGCVTNAPRCDGDDLLRAKELREAMQRTGEALAEKHDFDAGDIAIINKAAAKPPLVPELQPDGTSVRWIGNGLEAVLSIVARDLIEVSGTSRDACVRICENPACGSPFLDTSRAGRRRWCSMSTCGALTKKRNYRARLRKS